MPNPYLCHQPATEIMRQGVTALNELHLVLYQASSELLEIINSADAETVARPDAFDDEDVSVLRDALLESKKDLLRGLNDYATRYGMKIVFSRPADAYVLMEDTP